MKFVLDVKDYKGYTKTVLDDNGKDFYSEKTEADYIKEGYTVMAEEEFNVFEAEYNKSLCGKWTEITEEEYNNMLNVLPPLKWYDGGFYISEMTRADLSAFYQEWQGKYYTSTQSIFTDRQEILNSLKEYIEKSTEK